MPAADGVNQPTIATQIAAVKAEIADAAIAAGLDPAGVTLVAVSKTHPAEVIRDALDAGHRVFGENRVQEADGKWPALREVYPDLILHLIGPLQRNKVRRAVRLFDVIETIDRRDLAETIASAAAEAGRRIAVFVQVNTGNEPQKAGVPPDEADALVTFCRNDCGLDLRGLMCIPPVDADPAPHFTLLHEIAQRNGLIQLSMGMSGDFPIAVRLGATHVRVGTAIFGHRPLLAPAAAKS